MTTHRLGSELAAALAARQAAFLAGEGGEVWLLPAGRHELPDGLELGARGRELTLAGDPGTELLLASGPLRVRGSRVIVRHLAVVSRQGVGALEVDALEARLERVRVTAGRAGDDGSALAVRGEREARLNGCQVRVLNGASGIGVSVTGARVQLAGVQAMVTAEQATGIAVRAAERAWLSDCAARTIRANGAARGLRVIAPLLEVSGLNATDIRGATCLGLELLAPGPAGLVALGVSVADLRARGDLCQGLLVLSGGSLTLRGFAATTLTGAVCQGVTALGSGAMEIDAGHVSDLRGSDGGAGGMRVLCVDGGASVSVRDLAVEGLGGRHPRPEAQPLDAFTTWARQTADALAQEPFQTGAIPAHPPEASSEVVGLHVSAPLDAVDWSRGPRAGTVALDGLRLWRIAGTALQLEAGLRAAWLRRAELWTSARAGWLQADQLRIVAITVHRHLEPLRLGPGDVEVVNALFSGTAGDAAPRLEADALVDRIAAAYATGATHPWQPLLRLPYRQPGPSSTPASLAQGVRPPSASIDLSLAEDAGLTPVAMSGDPDPPHVGAWPVAAPSRCHLEDPERTAWRAPAAPEPPPTPVDYRARDAKALLRLMLERARASMPTWTEGGASDFSQMLLELLAERLDHLAYAQERAAAEGSLERARLRRSVEDHARALDYSPDPGLSATAMIRFQVDDDALRRAARQLAGDGAAAAADLLATLADGHPLVIPAGTVVGNADPQEASLLFATEADLAYRRELDAVRLVETCPAGATSARLRGRLEGLERGRWLVLSRGRAFPGHVVRVTELDLETDATVVRWDPRRPAAHDYPAEAREGEAPALAFGNVIPAHHGLPVRALSDEGGEEDLLARWRSLLEIAVDGTRIREVEVPLAPLSVRAEGYPLPGETRAGQPVLRVVVDGEEWRRVEDLSLAGPGDEVCVLRCGANGGPVVRFGDGRNGSALPQRIVALRLDLAVGLGSRGNVGAFTLNRLVAFGPVASDRTPPAAMILEAAGPERDDLVRTVWRVTNPLPGVGGRDPEPLERIRYQAPLRVREGLSAVTASDYERHLLRLPFVAGARARIVDTGVHPLARVTVLLREEDSLDEAELLRRWAVVRQRLETIRLLGFDVEVVPPVWVPLDIDLVVDAAPGADSGRLREAIEEALAGHGGLLDPDGAGLGGDVRLSDIHQTVQALREVRAVRVKRFRRLEPRARDHLSEGVIPVGDHEVATLGGPRHPGQGLLTVSVCGGLS